MPRSSSLVNLYNSVSIPTPLQKIMNDGLNRSLVEPKRGQQYKKRNPTYNEQPSYKMKLRAAHKKQNANQDLLVNDQYQRDPDERMSKFLSRNMSEPVLFNQGEVFKTQQSTKKRGVKIGSVMGSFQKLNTEQDKPVQFDGMFGGQIVRNMNSILPNIPKKRSHRSIDRNNHNLVQKFLL